MEPKNPSHALSHLQVLRRITDSTELGKTDPKSTDSIWISFSKITEVCPELNTPIYQRVFDVFEKDEFGQTKLEHFIKGLMLFNSNSTSNTERLKFCFALYDFDNDGFISFNDMQTCVKLMCGSYLTEGHVAEICESTIIKADMNGDGKLSLGEFLGFCKKNVLKSGK